MLRKSAIQPGDFVRRKKDHSGRVRRVGSINIDADGHRTVILSDYLDGWLIWDADALVAVPQEKIRNGSNQTNLQSSSTSPKTAHPRARAHAR